MRANTSVIGFFLVANSIGCSVDSGERINEVGGNGGTSSTLTSATTGGSNTVGGSGAIGGSLSTGITSATGGKGTLGGASSSGGQAATGGNISAGGNVATGGGWVVDTATGGGNVVDTATGGGSTVDLTTGGAPQTGTSGGAANAGGTKSTGGAVNTGGSKPVGGASAAGGNLSTGGASSAGTGGSTGVAGGTSTAYFGYQPVPNSQNTGNFDASTWYASWKSNYYVPCGSGQARIANGQGSSNTVSEGIGYGMLLAVGNADKTTFDALWAYYQANADVNGLMNWSINGCTTGNNNAYAATDADEDVAMALVQADSKWGGYKTSATSLIGLIKKYETVAGTPSYLSPGDAANNGGQGPGVVNPSYFAPGYWHVWATYVNDSFWNQLATDAYTMLAQYQTISIADPTNTSYTGALVPEWGTIQGKVQGGANYGYNACRTPWRVAVDYAWSGTSAAQTFLQNVSTFIDSRGGLASIATAYANNGAGNSAFLGPFAMSGLSVSQTTANTYLNAWLSAQTDDTPYFQGAIRGLCLLLANQNFPKGI